METFSLRCTFCTEASFSFNMAIRSFSFFNFCICWSCKWYNAHSKILGTRQHYMRVLKDVIKGVLIIGAILKLQ